MGQPRSGRKNYSVIECKIKNPKSKIDIRFGIFV